MVNADLHIHTCLSPCGDLDMSPRNIIRTAKEKGMDMIAITDHNSTRNVEVCMELGEKSGLYVVPGCEVNTREEVHTLCYFPHLRPMEAFQSWLDKRMTNIENDPDRFGYQVAVDEKDRIIYEEKRSLFVSIEDDIESVAEQVHRLGGIFVPAHIDRLKNSLIGQLGFVPFELEYEALEISKGTTPDIFLQRYPELVGKRFLQSSDAHYPEDIARAYTRFEMKELSWGSFIDALFHSRFETYRAEGRRYARTGGSLLE